jgi:hypothetical protein
MNEAENKAYNEGLDAQTNGALIDANPYPSGSTLFNSWELGWQTGADEDYEEDMNRD